jgi:uncharacterized protein (DUF2267 family)
MKHSNHVHAFNRSHEIAETWVRELCTEMHWLNLDDAYHLLRAVLHTLRDWTTVDEAAQFAAQLPLVLRGTFFEGWNPGAVTKIGRTKEEFVMGVVGRIAVNVKYDLESAIQTVIKVIGHHVSEGEMKDIFSGLPTSVRNLVSRPTGAPTTNAGPGGPQG